MNVYTLNFIFAEWPLVGHTAGLDAGQTVAVGERMKIFLSSTYEDLKLHRRASQDVITAFGSVFKGMEHFGASECTPLQACLQQLADSDLFICLIGTRYGSKPSGSEVSFTEMEIDEATRLGKPRLVYVVDDQHPVPLAVVDTGDDAAALMRLKERLQQELVIETFTTPDNLAWKMTRDLFRHVDQRDLTRNEAVMNEIGARRYRETAYDLLAEWYDDWYAGHWCSDEPFGTVLAIARPFLESRRGDLSRLKILDCACGTGNTFIAFARAGYSITGTDGSLEMLSQAARNCQRAGVSTKDLHMEQINWNELSSHLKKDSYDIIINTANSFCHVPPTKDHMDRALSNFRQLLKPRGLLIIDTKRYHGDQSNDGTLFRELRYDAAKDDWVIRQDREEECEIPDRGTVHFHTRLHYDVDPCFKERVQRALIVLTMYGRQLNPRTLVIPYYPLPADHLRDHMDQAGFTTRIFPAFHGLAASWKYDIVVGQKGG